MTTRKDGLSPTALRIWRYMRDEGGWWRPAEVAGALRLDSDCQMANAAATKAMQALEARRNVLRHAGHVDPRRPQYGVTARCTPPDWETLTPSPSHKPEAAEETTA